MKMLALLLLSGTMAAGCASSERNGKGKPSIENQVEIKSPEKQKQKKSQVYIDSVELIEYDNRNVLLVSGNFPDGCTHLGGVSHVVDNGMLELSLSAWREVDMMCTQALTPFSFIYDKLSEETLDTQSAIQVNGTTYELK